MIKKVMIISITVATLLYSTTLEESISQIIQSNPEIKALKNNNETLIKIIDKENARYLPKLNLSVTGEKKNVEKTVLNNPKTKDKHTGYDAKLELEQLLYDGGLSSSKIDAAKLSNKINILENEIKEDTIISTGVEEYLNLVKYDLRLKETTKYVNSAKEHLETAKSNELLSEDSLNTFEVQSKVHFANKKYLDELDNNQQAINTYKRLTLSSIVGQVCLPKVNKNLIANTLNEVINNALSNNKSILVQSTIITKQRAMIDQANSKNLPTLKFNISGNLNDDLITKDTQTDEYSAKIILNYNLYNGGSDSAKSEKEKISLLEEQHLLENTKNVVVEELSSQYKSYLLTIEKITQLTKYVKSNEKVLELYNLKFEGGEKTFVDVLSKESELYTSRIDLINERINATQSYYKILSLTSKLKTGILNSQNSCSEELNTPMMINIKNNYVENRIDVANLEEMIHTTSHSDISKIIKSTFESETAQENIKIYDGNKIRILSSDSSLKYVNSKIALSDVYKEKLSKYINLMISILESNPNTEMIIVGHSSSYYQIAKSKTNSFLLNLKISELRAEKVHEYLQTIVKKESLLKRIKTVGYSDTNTILNSNGTENINQSKRVEFIIFDTLIK